MSSQSQQEQDQDQENNEELQDEDQEQSSKQQESQKQAKSITDKILLVIIYFLVISLIIILLIFISLYHFIKIIHLLIYQQYQQNISLFDCIKKVRNYQKVPENLKSQLLKLVIQQGVKINQAAQQLNLKYATAKTIVFTYRAQSKPKKSKNKKKKTTTKVEFVPIQNNNVNPIHVEISIGGNVQNTFIL